MAKWRQQDGLGANVKPFQIGFYLVDTPNLFDQVQPGAGTTPATLPLQHVHTRTCKIKRTK